MIEKQPFGRTGHLSTRAIFGAAALADVTQPEADETLDTLLQHGVNHIDTAASYGEAELRLGPWMKQLRQRFFLATKTEQRTYRGAWDELHRSLKRLQVQYVDLWQMHFLVTPDEWEVAMGPGGALDAFIEARQQGLARFLGVTGHGLAVAAMHRKSLERHDFDAVLLPYNYTLMQNPSYAADLEDLLALCRQRNVAVQTIKSVVRRPWGDRPPSCTTWYEPLDEPSDVDRAVHWVLGRPGIFMNTAADVQLLPRMLEAATRFQSRPSDAEMQAMVAEKGMAPLFT